MILLLIWKNKYVLIIIFSLLLLFFLCSYSILITIMEMFGSRIAIHPNDEGQIVSSINEFN